MDNWRNNKQCKDVENKGMPQNTASNSRNRQRWRNHENRGSSHHNNSRNAYSKSKKQKTEEGFSNNSNLVEYIRNLNMKSSEDVMTLVAKKEEDFKKFLDSNMQPDVLVSTIQLMTNVSKASFTEILIRAISLTINTKFLEKLERFLLNLAFEDEYEASKNKIYHENINRFWADLIELLKKIIELIPLAASNKLVTLLQQMHLIIKNIEELKKYTIDDSFKVDIENMIKDLQKKIQQIETTCVSGNKTEFDPPENYRILNIIPKNEDLFDNKPFLRPCKVSEPYDTVEHYLDIQFRLLREDFVRPLRNGIKEYVDKTQTTNRNNDLRIYKNAKLTGFQVNKGSAGLQLYFGKLKFINWCRSKRFMYGSLLVLSKNNFKTSYFATVTNRDERDLENGYVMVGPCEGIKIPRDMFNCNIVVLESKIFFEPYFQVLTAMKKIDCTSFPMEHYFIKAETNVKLPHYLEDIPELKFRKNFTLSTKPDADWPSPKELDFDESQLSAFRSALTQEFAIVQGPPGTGKTFLALQVVRALLENKKNWRKYGPIVIVCLTNHALDQFLEGILSTTTSIVRVGSRSKNENLNPYTLSEKRKHSHSSSNAKSLMYNQKHDLEDILKSIKTFQLILEFLTTPNIIVPLDCFHDCQNQFPFKTFKRTEDLACWLIGKEFSSLMEKVTTVENIAINKKTETEPAFDERPYHKYDEVLTDADLILDYKNLEDIKIKGDLNILNLFDEHIQFIRNEIVRLQNKKSKKMHQEYLDKLIDKRNFINQEICRHPLINSRSQPTNHWRWKRYWEWIQRSHNFIMNQLQTLQTKYYKMNDECEELAQLVNLDVLKAHDVIGLTTTCAAKIQASLRALQAPIVLVEEAAEILESHIVCAMTKYCQHVILIGDHKQLRPKASVYELGKKFNLNVSLFERMVNIRGDCQQLMYQHRMRPQIAKLICPSIYKKLHNHDVVLNYPDVKGLTKNLFFLNHEHREQFSDNDDSCFNEHEVTFLTAFAKHLILQGYKPTEITILCTYTGQLFAFMKEMARYALLRQVHVTTVDNFQGEENKIILLSLVRNNGEGNIGFLKEENRVCVALSRAREGLYIMGNMNDLLEKNEIWPKIKNVLEENNLIGNTLTVKCQVHSDKSFEMKTADDFLQCPEGGCTQKCDLLLPCGHICTNICHILDRDHENYRCKQPCNRTCKNNHPCLLLCAESCAPCEVSIEQTLKCGHTVKTPCSADPETFKCPVEVEVILPDCNHNVKKLCYLPLDLCSCSYDCDIRLDCGHTCTQKCHVRSDPDHLEYKCYKDCTKKNLDCSEGHMCKKRCFENCGLCFVHVDKMRSCGHFYKNIPCSQKVEEIYCKNPCKRGMLDCGHKCQLQCSDDCKNCIEKVPKLSSCGHTIQVECFKEATPSLCDKKCPKTLPCGHPCTMKCKEQCTVACKVIVQVDELGLCGHKATMPCYLKNSDPKSPEILKYCEEPCNVQLLCNHVCKGTCGKCYQGRIHVSCSEPCRKIFICGHPCTTLCNQECRPCRKKCNIKCGHSRCNKICGEPCAPCQEQCLLKCEHQSCTKKCHEICDIKPCEEPCKKLLKCGHPCIGYCGDPCPKLCRVCNEEELTTIFLGNEDNSNARFVLLPDCGHTIEYEGLMSWLSTSTNSNGSVEIKAPTCPRCKAPIKNCLKTTNHVKNNLDSVILIKKKLFYQNTKNKSLRKNQDLSVNCINQMLNDSTFEGMKKLKEYMQNIKMLGIPFRKKRKQILSFNEVHAFKSVVDILNEILSLKKQMKLTNISTNFILDQINIIVESLPHNLFVSKQRLEDINVELRRLNLMFKVYAVFSDFGLSSSNKTEFDFIIQKLSKSERFTKSLEEEIILDATKLSAENAKNLIIDRKVITAAVKDIKAGSWFACPNNHFYAIGDCGGAMQSRRCLDCDAMIGGANHKVTRGNRLATEIDGATTPAWPSALTP